MTHPDDEISICVWIKTLIDNGNEVFISWTHSNPVREKEGRAAAALMGVPAANLIFFGAKDQGIVDQIPDLLEDFRLWFDEIKPDRVACGAFEQGHIDHDATNYIVNRTFKGPVFEIPFYHSYLVRLQRINQFADPRGEEIRRLDKIEQRFKKQIAKQYPSQNIWSVLLWYEVLQGSKLKRFELAQAERMRLQTHKDFLTPNLPPRMASRVRRCAIWKRWEHAIQNWERRL
jgi:LmbE family N-acetylglucosaminyl deacetylase